MNDPKSNEYNEIKKLFLHSCKNPLLSMYCALAIDRIIDKNKLDIRITFARSGYVSDVSHGETQIIPINPSSGTPQHFLVKTKGAVSAEDRVKNAYNKLKGDEINIINLLYANYVRKYPSLWVYFINKYLRIRNGWELRIDNGDVNYLNLGGVVSVHHKDDFPDVKVSILMPTFNNEDTVMHSCQSILQQTHKNLELIIIDDASTDNTYNKCQDLVKSDSRVKYIRNQINIGAYASRNRGLEIADGDYVTILDGDDWSFPQRINFQLKQIINNNSIAHVGAYLRLSSHGTVQSFKKINDYSLDGALHKCLATLMIELSFLKNSVGYWDMVKYGADSEFYFRLKKIADKKIVETYTPLIIALDRASSLTNNEISKIGSNPRQMYIDNFTAWHERTDLCGLKLKFPLRNRPFEIHPDMVVNLDNVEKVIGEDSGRLINVGIFGTCRLHRPFLKNNLGYTINNTKSNIKIHYPRVGFLHTLPEICQAIQILDGSLTIPEEFLPFIFRKENISTTPSNEFDQEIDSKIKTRSKLYLNRNYISNLDVLLIEVSSLSINLHEKSGLVLHTNPNFIHNIPYKDIYPSYYEKYHSDLGVRKISLDDKHMIQWMNFLKYLVKDIPIIVTGHLNSSNTSNEIRQKINEMLSIVSNKCNVFFFDTTPFVDKFGYRIINGVEDRHHLSDLGEEEYGIALQKFIEKVIKNNLCDTRTKSTINEYVFTSIGENCLSQGLLKRYKLNSLISPFSWGRSNIDYIIQLVQEDFQDLLNPTCLEEKNISGKTVIVNNKYHCNISAFSREVANGFEFTHHNIKDDGEVHKSYLRKIERFKSLIVNNQVGILLYHHRNQSGRNLAYIESQLVRLLSILPNKNLFIINFSQLIVANVAQRGLSIDRNNNVFNVVLSTEKFWGGNNKDEFWGIIDDDLLKQMIYQVIKMIYLSDKI
jgi:glycosyltransferase involved in cell wall biosynthesis